MKKGDKVYAAHLWFGGVEVNEAEVASVTPAGRVRLLKAGGAWSYRTFAEERDCHTTRRDAIRSLLADALASLEIAKARVAEIESALAKEPQP
jgi:hypothetical protein